MPLARPRRAGTLLLLGALWAASAGGQGGAVITGRVRVDVADLADVLVYVRSGLPARAKYQAPAAPVAIELRGCRLRPRVVPVMAGQALELRNLDSLPHRIGAAAARNRGFDVTLAPGERTRRYLATPEIPVGLRCDAHAEAAAYVAVLAHPFYALTGTDGRYSLRGLPAGTYSIEAWHHRYGTRAATLTVTGAGAQTHDFRFAAP